MQILRHSVLFQMVLGDLVTDDLHIESKAVHRLVNYPLSLVDALETASIDLLLLLGWCHVMIDHDFDGVF